MEPIHLDNMPDVLTIEETARLLRVGRNTVYEAVRSGNLPALRVGRRILVPKRALEEWLRAAEDAPPER